jgi:hypothetical protein
MSRLFALYLGPSRYPRSARRDPSAGGVARLRVVTALRLALAALTFVGAGCATNHGSGSESDAAGRSAAESGAVENDAAEADEQCPPGVACDCTYVDGAYYKCGMDGGIPACPADAEPGSSCASVSLGTLCAACPEGAGEWCTCGPEDAGPQWGCIGTEYPCKGP